MDEKQKRDAYEILNSYFNKKGFRCKRCGHCCSIRGAPKSGDGRRFCSHFLESRSQCLLQKNKPLVCRRFPRNYYQAQACGCLGFAHLTVEQRKELLLDYRSFLRKHDLGEEMHLDKRIASCIRHLTGDYDFE